MHVGNVHPGWDFAAFREYVIGHARNARVAHDQASLSKVTQIDSGLLGRYFRGETQPGPANLAKINEAVPGTTMQELLVLAGRATTESIGLRSVPTAPVPTLHPIADQVDRLLGDDSPLSPVERGLLAELLSHVLDRYDQGPRSATA
ncbi:hypothetical protein TPA0907_55420 [Micromonospora humidisoli]|nr:hypothetical protein TPA0907_55420 [Micromonospora sp. AKA109]